MNTQEKSAHWKGTNLIWQDQNYTRFQDSDGSISIPARALNITWGNDSRYWEWIGLDEADRWFRDFEKAALLEQVNWLEVTGKVDFRAYTMPFRRSFQVYFIVKFREDAFGWDRTPIKFIVKVNGEEVESEETKTNEIDLHRYREDKQIWHEILAGEFTDQAKSAESVEFGMFEVETNWWKGGMVLGGIKIKPT